MQMMNHVDYLKAHDACYELVSYAETQPTMQALWDNCLHPNWMLWLIMKVDAQTQIPELSKILRLYACWCVRNTPLHDGRKVWDLVTGEHDQDAVEIAERFANGCATPEELAAAYSASSSDIYFDTYAPSHALRCASTLEEMAAAYAADAAASCAASCFDSQKSNYSVGLAVNAAINCVDYYPAACAARDAARDAQADQLRAVIPYSVIKPKDGL